MVKLFSDKNPEEVKAEVERLSSDLLESKVHKSPNPGLEKKIEENSTGLNDKYLGNTTKKSFLKEYGTVILIGGILGLPLGLGINYISNEAKLSNYTKTFDSMVPKLPTFNSNLIDYKKN